MREVFAHMSSAEVSVRRAMLEEEGIPTFVRNEALSSLTNAFAAPFQPALCVIRDEDYDRALSILHTLNTPQSHADWSCPNCHEEVPGEFEVCWNCQTARPESNV